LLLSPPWGKSAASAGGAEPGQAQAPEGRPAKKPDVTYEPTSQHIVEKMLEVAEVKKGDVLYDLGCGDGRIVVTAAKRFGVKGVGIDIDPERIRDASENVRKNGVANLVTIKQADLFEADLSEASVVTLYLTSPLNVRLMPRLAKLKPGTRIVSHLHDMEGAKPKKVVTIEDRPGVDHEIYLWVVPWEKE
jgi:precorrin-6B methylase 2